MLPTDAARGASPRTDSDRRWRSKTHERYYDSGAWWTFPWPAPWDTRKSQGRLNEVAPRLQPGRPAVRPLFYLGRVGAVAHGRADGLRRFRHEQQRPRIRKPCSCRRHGQNCCRRVGSCGLFDVAISQRSIRRLDGLQGGTAARRQHRLKTPASGPSGRGACQTGPTGRRNAPRRFPPDAPELPPRRHAGRGSARSPSRGKRSGNRAPCSGPRRSPSEIFTIDVAAITLPARVGAGKHQPAGLCSFLTASSVSPLARDNGTLCSRPPFIRSAGMRHSAACRFNGRTPCARYPTAAVASYVGGRLCPRLVWRSPSRVT